jgi:hypothetical protein
MKLHNIYFKSLIKQYFIVKKFKKLSIQGNCFIFTHVSGTIGAR